jgi:hypothetical protein
MIANFEMGWNQLSYCDTPSLISIVGLSTHLKLIQPLLQAYVKVHDARRLAQFTGGRIQ